MSIKTYSHCHVSILGPVQRLNFTRHFCIWVDPVVLFDWACWIEWQKINFDSYMSFHAHVSSICRSSFYHLRNLTRIRKYFTKESPEVAVHAFVTSKLDFCNALLHSLCSWRYCVGARLIFWRQSCVPKKGSRDEVVEILPARKPRYFE